MPSWHGKYLNTCSNQSDDLIASLALARIQNMNEVYHENDAIWLVIYVLVLVRQITTMILVE